MSGILMAMMVGQNLPVLAMSDHSASAMGGQSGTASFYILSDGRARGDTNVDGDGVSTYYSGEWAGGTFPTSITGEYEVMFTYVSGTNSNGGGTNTGFFSVNGDSYGVWLNCGTNRYRSISRSAGTLSGGTVSCVFDATIRKVGTTTPTYTGRITLTAQGIPL